jgi:hypothetical protein
MTSLGIGSTPEVFPAPAFVVDEKFYHKIRYRKSLRVQLFAWAEKTVLGMIDFFCPTIPVYYRHSERKSTNQR